MIAARVCPPKQAVLIHKNLTTKVGSPPRTLVLSELAS